MKRAALATLALAASLGCDKARDTGLSPDVDHPQEAFILSETTRFGKLLNVKAVGKLTDEAYRVAFGQWGCTTQGGCLATGWWIPPEAWYYRPHIQDASFGLISDIAAHEVCHSRETQHNEKHRQCIYSVGQLPTYGVTYDGLISGWLPEGGQQ